MVTDAFGEEKEVHFEHSAAAQAKRSASKGSFFMLRHDGRYRRLPIPAPSPPVLEYLKHPRL